MISDVGVDETLGDACSCGGDEIADGLRPNEKSRPQRMCFANASVTMRHAVRPPVFPHSPDTAMLSADLMAEIAADEVLEQAYLWLCDRRKDYSPNNDVWTLRWHWREVKTQVQQALLSGSYRFTALERFSEGEDTLDIWSSQDALVLKAIAIVLTRHLAPHLPKTCHHLAGNGGAKAAVRRLSQGNPQQRLHLPLGREELLRQHQPRNPLRPIEATRCRSPLARPALAIPAANHLRRRTI